MECSPGHTMPTNKEVAANAATRREPSQPDAAGNIAATVSGELANDSLPDNPSICSSVRSRGVAGAGTASPRRGSLARTGEPKSRLTWAAVSPATTKWSCTFASACLATISATVSPKATNLLKFALKRSIDERATSFRTAVSSAQSAKWTPCTTGRPAWVRRALTASRCIGLQSPETSANWIWSASVKVLLAKHISFVMPAPAELELGERDGEQGSNPTGSSHADL